MTRQEAAEKVAKLARLSKDNTNPHEAEAARSQARKIVKEHGLTLEELSAGKKALAFDDVVARVRAEAASRLVESPGLFNTSSILSDALARLETLSEASKAKRLDESYKLVDAIYLFNSTLSVVGLGSPAVNTVKKIFDDTLAAHGLTPP